MKSAYLPAALLTVAWFLFWSAPSFAQDAKGGQAVFTKSCASCHAADGAPKEAVAKMMKVTMRSLASAEVQAKSDADLKKDILQGTGKMKPVKLTDPQAASLIAFLRTLKLKK